MSWERDGAPPRPLVGLVGWLWVLRHAPGAAVPLSSDPRMGGRGSVGQELQVSVSHPWASVTQLAIGSSAFVRTADLRYDVKESVLRLRCEMAYIRDDQL